MLKKGFFITFVYTLFIFFFCNAIKVNAGETLVEILPKASEIAYGQPLFESVLSEGKANVDGTFYWKDPFLSFNAGQYVQKVVFKPFDVEYNSVEMNVVVRVKRRKIYLKFEGEIFKQYDGKNSIRLPNYIVGGVLDEDDVYLTGSLEGVLENVLVGKSNVLLSGVELAGNDEKNYYLDLNGVEATIYRDYVEKFGNVKNRVDFGKDIYVPMDSIICVDKLSDYDIKKVDYDIREVYDIYLKSDQSRVDVDGIVNVKVMIDEDSFNYKKVKIYNYYNGAYEKVEYKYEDGYIIYTAKGLGSLVFAQKRVNMWWLNILIIIFVLSVGVFIFIIALRKREKFNKYKSIKPGKKDYECY